MENNIENSNEEKKEVKNEAESLNASDSPAPVEVSNLTDEGWKEATTGETVIAESFLSENKEENDLSEDKGLKFGWGVLGFFVPLVGLILFLVWRGNSQTKRKAKASGIGAIVGAGVGFIVLIVTVIGLAMGGAISRTLDDATNTSLSSSYQDSSSDTSSGLSSNSTELQDMADSVNEGSQASLKAMGGLYSDMHASVEDSNTFKMSYTFSNTVDPSVYASDTMKSAMKSTMTAATSPIYAEAKYRGVTNMNVHVEILNPDGTVVFDVTITQADHDSSSTTQSSVSNQ